MRSTKQEIRGFYDQSPQYEVFQKNQGWATPRLLVERVRPYLREGKRVVDVGCGPGLVGEELKRIGWSGMLVGVDIAEKRLREAMQKPEYTFCVAADAYCLPFRDDSFDITLSNAMVGLTGVRSVQEMYRLVKPKGYFACVAGEILSLRWCRVRFRSALRCLDSLPNARVLLRKDLGTGYTDTDYADEHYICFVCQKM